jgi:DNA-binding response OmpR family regulator
MSQLGVDQPAFRDVRHPIGELVSREDLLRQIWELESDPGTNVLDVHVGRLRRKLDKLGEPLIENVRGHGYRIVARRLDEP